MSLLLSLFISLSALAIPIAPLGDCMTSLLTEAKFQDVTKIKGGLSATAAIAKITMPDGSRCSASYISDQGHMLTATHCLEGCFRSKRIRAPQRNLQCILDIGGKKTKVRVLMMSVCEASQVIKESLTGKETCPDEADVAVVLPDSPPASFACLGISTTVANTGDAVMALGHPGYTNRPGGGNSDGAGMYASYGKVIQQDYCTVTEGNTTRTHPLGGIENTRDHFIQTTVDVVPGSSGGPLINQRGEIVGVTSFITAPHSQERECKGGTFFEPLTSIDGMATRWGSRGEIQSMSCDRRKVKTK